jgi:hypothetical protein
MLAQTKSFIEPSDTWDVHHVTTMDHVSGGRVVQPTSGLYWDISGVTSMWTRGM